MNYQVSSRISYLKNFTYLFKEVDINSDGVINKEEFCSFINKFKCYSNHLEEQLTRLTSLIDPYNLEKISYSDCISLFSKEKLDFDGSVVNVMDFLAYNWNSFYYSQNS